MYNETYTGRNILDTDYLVVSLKLKSYILDKPIIMTKIDIFEALCFEGIIPRIITTLFDDTSLVGPVL